jgi:hypothetical protein
MRARFRMVVIALLAVFAIGAVAAATASAKNPTWMVCKGVTAGSGKFEDSLCSKGGKGSWEASELLTGETKEISAEAAEHLLITFGPGPELQCNKFKTQSGAKIVGGEPGAGEEVIVLEECFVRGEEWPTCLVNGKEPGTITTNTLASKLVYLTKEAAEKENAEATGTQLKPKTGKVIATVTFPENGSGHCPNNIHAKEELTGELLVENLKGGAHASKQEIVFSEHEHHTYWVQEGKTLKEEESKIPKWDGIGGVFEGRTFLKLTSNEAFWIS